MSAQRTTLLLFGEKRSGQWPADTLQQPSAPTLRDATRPLVSIVTPSYNQGQFIRETIESVLSQDYPNIEYWVIDGGSSDDTVAILREYEKDSRFHWLSERDGGQADAVNKGWGRCRGEILCWLNSDDSFVNATVVRMQTQALLENPDVALVYGDGIYVDERGNFLSYYPTRPYFYPDLLLMNYILQPTVFLRRNLIEQVGPLDTSFRFAMDRDYWLRCSMMTRFLYNPIPIATYRLHTNSKTVDANIPLNIEGFGATYKHFAGGGGKRLTRGRRRRTLASSLLILAVRAINADEIELARRMVRGAWHLDRTNLRYPSVLISFIDRLLGTGLQPRLAGLFFYLANPKMRHKRLSGDH